MATLIVKSPDGVEREIALVKRITSVGRDAENDVRRTPLSPLAAALAARLHFDGEPLGSAMVAMCAEAGLPLDPQRIDALVGELAGLAAAGAVRGGEEPRLGPPPGLSPWARFLWSGGITPGSISR